MTPRALLPALLFLVSTLPACPAPTNEATTVAPPPDGGPPPPTDGAAQPPPPTDGGPPPMAPGMVGASSEVGSMINPEQLKFSRFVAADQKTVTITVHVEGATGGQIDIVSLAEVDGNTAPTVLHTESFTGTTPVVITAPATYADSLYISALVKVDKSGKDAPPPSGPMKVDAKQVSGLAEAVKLEGKDLDVTVKMGTLPKWLEKLSEQAAAPPPPAGGQLPGPPPGGAPLLPPDGAPPGGAPPAPPPGDAPPPK